MTRRAKSTAELLRENTRLRQYLSLILSTERDYPPRDEWDQIKKDAFKFLEGTE